MKIFATITERFKGNKQAESTTASVDILDIQRLNSLGYTLPELEKEYVTKVLEQHNNRRQAASILGIQERQIYRLINKYGLPRRRQ